MVLSYNSISGGSGAVSNDFNISLGTSGYTRTTLSQTFPAGNYVVTSSLSDTTLDIYLLAEDGSLSGYVNTATATSSISASAAFKNVVVYGGSNNDTLSFVFKYVFNPSENSVNDYASVPPRLISATPAALPNQNDTTVITGQNFGSTPTVTFTGTDAVARSAKSVTRDSSTQITVTRPDTMPPSASPYTITVNNPGTNAPTSTNSHKLNSYITAGNVPSWVTSTSLPAFQKNAAYSTTISALDSDGGSSVSYSYVSGALPSGLSFDSSTATISGTPTDNGSMPYSYTVRTTDSGGNSVDRTFTLTQILPDPPTIGTASKTNTAGAVSVSFTPAITGAAATTYTVTSSPGNITASGSSSPITVPGLTQGQAYTFTVKANNANGSSFNSAGSNSVNAPAAVKTKFTSTQNWTVPAGVTSIQVVAVGGGGAGGGAGTTTTGSSVGGGAGGAAITYNSSVSVTPGTSYTITVGAGGAGASTGVSGSGGTSSFGALVTAGGGGGGSRGGGAGSGSSAGSGGTVISGPNGGAGYASGTAMTNIPIGWLVASDQPNTGGNQSGNNGSNVSTPGPSGGVSGASAQGVQVGSSSGSSRNDAGYGAGAAAQVYPQHTMSTAGGAGGNNTGAGGGGSACTTSTTYYGVARAAGGNGGTGSVWVYYVQ